MADDSDWYRAQVPMIGDDEVDSDDDYYGYTHGTDYWKRYDVTTDNCKDAADQAVWTKDGKADFASDLSACGHQCLGGASCTAKCIEKRRGYTEACSNCFGTLTGCTKDNCMFDCMMDATGSSCKNCVDKSCTPAFETCSGLTPPSKAELLKYTSHCANGDFCGYFDVTTDNCKDAA